MKSLKWDLLSVKCSERLLKLKVATGVKLYVTRQGFPGGLDGKKSACHAEDLGLIPWSGRSPGGGHGNPFQHSCLENAMDRGA